MTIKELAEFTKKNKSTIGRWAELCGRESVKYQLQNATSSDPADFDLNEVEAILRAGSMSGYTVDLLMENAKKKDQLQNATDAIDYDRLAMVIATAVTTALAGVAGIAKEQAQKSLPAPETHMTLAGYCRIHEIEYDNISWLRGTAITVKGICWNRGLEVHKVPDERWGTVNSYPIPVLDEYFGI